MTEQVQLSITYEVVSSIEELTPQERQVFVLAQQATNNAYAPYSNFMVGAALLLSDGSTHQGTNQENAAYPSGLCAERTLLFGVGSNHPDKQIEMMAVTVRRRHEEHFLKACPCGACRQVIAEYQSRQQAPIKLLMQAEDGKVMRMKSIEDLLPFMFTKDQL
ncbi:cytidine deaminase [Rufibacter glacialis]|uniref:Cytidine deaminase n=1 Tax=Rufibacter glacialis TaxID=1259555 RepID=A0A5M8QKM2_9BACT|nr:cytidine deaminase [Rufibacter glacialis]KAA6435701.1 cytidine deaminase [Rufibacter glacialis]GGK65787.1 cytidine deaminase [Rufibacter glacialis]